MGKCFSVCTGDENNTNISSKTDSSMPSQRNFHESTQKCSFSKTQTERTTDINAIDIRRSLHIKPEYDQTKIEGMFQKYKDDEEEAILEDGMEKLCQDLGVNPTEFVVLVLAWKFNASKMCRFTRKEFTEGCKLLRVDSVRALRQKLNGLEKDVRKNIEDFRDLYRFTFGFGLDVDEGQRVLPINMAVPLWKLVFDENAPDFMGKWYLFLEESAVKAIPRDTWNMFLHMAEVIKGDFSNYDESEAWPSLFDDFVEQQRKTAYCVGNGIGNGKAEMTSE